MRKKNGGFDVHLSSDVTTIEENRNKLLPLDFIERKVNV